MFLPNIVNVSNGFFDTLHNLYNTMCTFSVPYPGSTCFTQCIVAFHRFDRLSLIIDATI